VPSKMSVAVILPFRVRPWVIMTPGVALFVLVLGINLLSDGLRDLLGADLRR
jgi:ABC-type dipeptide/oligopeptide/nickel transport system permease subunit